jgi:hypothetical protein
MGTGGPFSGGKAQPGRDADHSPPSTAEVINEYELDLSPSACIGVLWDSFTFLCMTGLQCIFQPESPKMEQL